MSEHTGERIDTYIGELFLFEDEAQRAALQSMREAGLPSIQVPAALGRLLGILTRAVGARRVLEIGTLGGYSAIWMARALPSDGTLISLEADAHHAEVARANLERAGLSARTEVRLGRALDLLPVLAGDPPFDLAFIDANKDGYPDYLEWALRLVRPGGLIVADNVLRDGAVVNSATADDAARAVDRFNRAAAADPRLDAIILPNRGGHDGILVAAVRERTA